MTQALLIMASNESPSNNIPSFFTTSTGKAIGTVSENARARALSLFKDMDEEQTPALASPSSSLCRFPPPPHTNTQSRQRESFKKEVSEKTLSSEGFSCSNSKRLGSVSEKSLALARSLLQDDAEDTSFAPAHTPVARRRFSLSSAAAPSPSPSFAAAFQTAKHISDPPARTQSPMDTSKESLPNNFPSFFTTSTGKAVGTVSECARARALRLFNDMDEEQSPSLAPSPIPSANADSLLHIPCVALDKSIVDSLGEGREENYPNGPSQKEHDFSNATSFPLSPSPSHIPSSPLPSPSLPPPLSPSASPSLQFGFSTPLRHRSLPLSHRPSSGSLLSPHFAPSPLPLPALQSTQSTVVTPSQFRKRKGMNLTPRGSLGRRRLLQSPNENSPFRNPQRVRVEGPGSQGEREAATPPFQTRSISIDVAKHTPKLCAYSSSSSVGTGVRPSPLHLLFPDAFDSKRISLADFALMQPPPHLTCEVAAAIPPHILFMTYDSASSYRIQCEGSTLGPDEFLTLLHGRGGVQSILTREWVSHHYKLIIWGTAAYIRSFYNLETENWLSKEIIFNRLCHRYDVEYVLGKRSCVRLILEKDGQPSRHMVLCVCQVVNVGETDDSREFSNSFSDQSGEASFSSENGNLSSISPAILSSSSSSSSSSSATTHLILTDGWYEIKATLDTLLLTQLQRGKIYPGMKLRIFGASLVGNSVAMSPLDGIHGRHREAEPSLRLSYNGTRRAKWDSKLGFQRKNVFSVPIHQVRTDGGQMPRLSAVVQRVYPPLVMCKKPNGAAVVHSMREYEGISRSEQESKEQKIHEWIEKQRTEMEQKRGVSFVQRSGGVIQEYQTSPDPAAFLHSLPREKVEEIERGLRRIREEEEATLRHGLDSFTRKLEAEGVSGTEFLTVKISDDPAFLPIGTCSQIGSENSQSDVPLRFGNAYFTIWRPSTEDHSLFREGQRIALYCVSPYVPKNRSNSLSEEYGNPIRLTNTKSTRWRPLPPHCNGGQSQFSPRSCLSLGDLTTEMKDDFEESDFHSSLTREIDVACILVGVSLPYESTYPSGNKVRIQYLFICDDTHTLCVVRIRGTGCHVPYPPLSTHWRLVSIKNLTHRPGSTDATLHVPLLDACEKSIFCESVGDDYLTGRGEAINAWLMEDAAAAGYLRSQSERVAGVLDDYRHKHR